MLNTGDFAFDTVAGVNVQILERIEMWGYTSYKVFNPATGRVYKATEEQLNTSGQCNSVRRELPALCGFALENQKRDRRWLFVCTGKRDHPAAAPAPCAEPCNGDE